MEYTSYDLRSGDDWFLIKFTASGSFQFRIFFLLARGQSKPSKRFLWPTLPTLDYSGFESGNIDFHHRSAGRLDIVDKAIQDQECFVRY